MSSTKEKQYFNEINIMRGMAVLCVVIGHSFNATDSPTILGFLKNFVYCFHMPAFFFISGFLVKEQDTDWSVKAERIKKKAKRLMVPYLFLTLVSVCLKMIFGVFARHPLNYNTLAVDVIIGRNNPNGGLWFLYALFIISAVGILLDKIDSRIMLAVTFVLYLLNALIFHQFGYILGFLLGYAWYYYGGIVFRKYCYNAIKNFHFINSLSGRIAAVLLSAVYLAIVFVRIYISDMGLFACTIPVIGIFLLYVIAIQTETSGKGRKFWMLLGDYGMDIYMIGYYVQQTIYVILGKILGTDYLIYAWCMCIFGLIAPIIISKYIVRKNKVLSLLILGR